NQNLRARNYFRTDLTRFPTKPKNIFHQYGGTFGGPIKKDKLFFFGDFQRTTQRNIGTATLSLPTATMRTGDFRGSGVTIYDPATGDASGNNRLPISCNGVQNVICANRIDPAAAKIVSSMPALTNPNALTNNLVTAANGLQNINTFDTKINYVMSERSMVFGRYSLSQAHIFDPPTFGAALGGDAINGGQLGNADNRTQSAGLGGTYTFSPNLLADWNFGFTRLRLGATALDIGTAYGLDTLGISGTNGFGTTGDPSLYNGIPAMAINSVSNIGNPNTGNPFLFRDNQYVTGENLSWTRGKHALRFGFEYDHTQLNHFQPQGSDGNFTTARGSFNFNGNLTTQTTGSPVAPGNGFAQFLLGLANRAGKATLSFNPVAMRWTTWAWYVRDQWQIVPNLTINAGVRWEYYPPGYGDNGHGLPLYNPTNNNIYIGGLGSVPMNSNLDAGSGQFLPRVGLAYRLRDKTVIRAGYGMSADPYTWHFLRNAYPGTITTDIGTSTGRIPVLSLTGTNATGGSYNTVPTGLASSIVPIPNVSSGVIPLPVGAGTRTFANPYRRGYINSFNLTVQNQFTNTLTAEVGYVGARAIRPPANVNLNGAAVCPAGLSAAACRLAPYGEPLTIAFGHSVADVSSIVPFKNNYYDSLQTKMTQRLGGDSFIGVSYTYSKAIDYTENEDLSGLFEHNPLYWSLDKALAGFDRTHNLQVFGLYELPFGKGKRWGQSGVASWLAGGWQLNAVLSRLSGTPFNLTGSAGLLNPGTARGLNETVNLVGSYHVIGGNPWSLAGTCPNTSCDYFDPSIFAQPTAGNFGNVHRNTFRGPGVFGIDASIFRDFKLTERFTFQFRTELFGLTNTPRFSNPNGACSSGAGAVCLLPNNNFGSITSTLGTSGSGASTDGARQIWFAGKLVF
ncbi:MAG TPA: TonB-dependent receptor, partial [Terriglobales bacterium]|nr:TonB-dependent receptor [Terriglobales bacterium]